MVGVAVWASDAGLRDALAAALNCFTPVRLLPDLGSARWEAPSVLVAPAGDCPPEACKRLASDRWRVVILVPVPRALERVAYLGAGATGYVPMTVGLDALREAVSQAAMVA